MKIALASALFLAASAWASDVLSLTSSDFNAKVKPEELMLVEFFAPWCGHCKALAPEYEKAATTLKEQGVKLAKVDCTSESEVCSEQGIGGYPTLKVFRNGTPSEYAGTRKADGIVSYMKKQALPAVSIVDQSNHTEFQNADRIVLVAYLDEKDAANKKAFQTFAEGLRDEFLFGLTTDPEAVAAAGHIQTPALVMYKQFDEGRNDLTTGDFSASAITAFLKEHATPLFDEITPDNFAMYAEANMPLAYLFIPADDEHREHLVETLKPVASKNKGKINFVWIDAKKFSDHGKSLNLQEPKWPAFAIQKIQDGLKFPLSQKEDANAETIEAFVEKFNAGDIKPSVKSEPVPKSQEGPVQVIVADTFEETVADLSKDYFVEFYAPWCGHCKKLAPTWESLGERYSNSKDKLVVGKFDAHNNDIPGSSGIRVQGFPTIKFRPAGSTEWVDYVGNRSLESFVEFIEQKAVNSVSPNETPAGGEADQVVMGGAEEAKGHDEL